MAAAERLAAIDGTLFLPATAALADHPTQGEGEGWNLLFVTIYAYGTSIVPVLLVDMFQVQLQLLRSLFLLFFFSYSIMQDRGVTCFNRTSGITGCIRLSI